MADLASAKRSPSPSRAHNEAPGEEAGSDRPTKRQKLSSLNEDHASLSEKSIAADPPLLFSTTDANGDPLSKNQLKKARRKAEWEASRENRKIKRRVKTKEKRERQRADPTAYSAWRIEKRDAAAQDRKSTLVPITIVYDCGYDGLMNDNERISLGNQLTRAYSDNRKARWRGHMVVSSWGGNLKERFETVLNRAHENWKGVKFDEASFKEVVTKAGEWMRGEDGGLVAGALVQDLEGEEEPKKRVDAGNDELTTEATMPRVPSSEVENGISLENGAPTNETPSALQPQEEPRMTETTLPPSAHEPKFTSTRELSTQGETIYLSSDSPYTLTRLRPYSTYIIGGLVDKNRHKGACYKAACDAGLQTAKLPIGDYMRMQSREVLATSHVGEIMLKWIECGDWGEAFLKVIPKRKGGVLRGTKDDGQVVGELEEEEVEDRDAEMVDGDVEEDADESDGGVPLDAETLSKDAAG